MRVVGGRSVTQAEAELLAGLWAAVQEASLTALARGESGDRLVLASRRDRVRARGDQLERRVRLGPLPRRLVLETRREVAALERETSRVQQTVDELQGTEVHVMAYEQREPVKRYRR